jgi:3-dehydroquinate dehydratase-2
VEIATDEPPRLLARGKAKLEVGGGVGFNAARSSAGMVTRAKPAKSRVSDDQPAADARPARVLVIHGPNLNLLGEREPEIYGRTRLRDIDRELKRMGREMGLAVETFQSNGEGAIVDRIQRARGKTDILLINPGAYTHTSVAIRDAIIGVDLPVIEVHLSNVYKREPFRHRSTIADVAAGRIMGFGAESYYLALRAALSLARNAKAEREPR